MALIFVDGQHGTAGLSLGALLRTHPRLRLLELPHEHRRSVDARRDAMRRADLVVLCLPSAAVPNALALAPDVRVVDVSNLHRCSAGWAYGLPELGAIQREAIRAAKRVSNPGCFATAFIIAAQPLVAAGVIRASDQVHCFALTGYSAGGLRMIERHERGDEVTRVVSLDLDHRHLPEMQAYAGLHHPPLFVPTVGTHRSGLHLTIPLCADFSREELLGIFHDRYERESFVRVVDESPRHLSPVLSTPTNQVELYVTGARHRYLVSVRLHNLIKGAGGTALQNINLMLGLPETEGLT